MITGDYHTHTVYSHGKGSVEDNVLAAVKLGLKEIAITDHGFGHLIYNVRKSDFKYFLEDISVCREKYPQIKIYAGIEANFVSEDGDIDLSGRSREKLDIAVCGYHKFAAGGFFDFFSFTLPRLLFSKNSEKTISANTDAYIKAMENNRIDIISHPGYGAKIDIMAVGEAAKELGVLLELNGKRVNIKDEELLALADIGCEFIINSDAHSPERVGEVSLPVSVIERSGLPKACIANWDKLPVFRGKAESAT